MPPPPSQGGWGQQAATNPYAAGQVTSGPPGQPWTAGISALATATIVALGLDVLLFSWNVINNFRGRAGISSGDVDTLLSVADSAETLRNLSILLQFLTAAIFMVWFYRVWTSDRSLASNFGRSAGFATWGWIIPFANWILGGLATRELWAGTKLAKERDAGIAPTAGGITTPPLVLAWWVTWVGGFVFNMITRFQTNNATSISDVESGLLIEIISSALFVAAGVLMIMVVRQIMAFCKR